MQSADVPSVGAVFQLLSSGGLTAVLIYALWLGKNGEWVWRRQLDDKDKEIERLRDDIRQLRGERDTFIEHAFRATSAAEKTAAAIRTAVGKGDLHAG